MEKTKLIENLKTRVGEDNCKVISDKTFEGIAESVLAQFENDENITEDTWKLPVATLIQFAGQKRFDEKTFAEEFKKEYASQHEKDVEERIKTATQKALEDYKKEHPENGGGSGGNGLKAEDIVKSVLESLNSEDGALGKFTKQFNDFVKSQNEREKTAVLNKVKTELKQHLIDLKANVPACIDDALDDIDYGETPTFESLKQKAIDAYEKRYKRYYPDGGKPFGGGAGGGGGEDDTYVKQRLKQLEEEAKANANYSQEFNKSLV